MAVVLVVIVLVVVAASSSICHTMAQIRTSAVTYPVPLSRFADFLDSCLAILYPSVADVREDMAV